MIMTFLGTAASEGFPDAFCGCDNCRRAREQGGRSLRKRSSALIDGELLLDLGPDLMAASQIHAIPLDRLRYCLQTHDHSDHLDPSHLMARSTYCGVHGTPRLAMYAAPASIARAAAALGRHAPIGSQIDPHVAERMNLEIHTIGPGQTFEPGPYRVTSVAATHAPDALLYVIERGGRRLFYATDTGPLTEAAWQTLATVGGPLHVVVLDHTFGFTKRSSGHLNAEQFLEVVERMRAERLLTAESRIIAHHFAHHSHPTHDELAAYAAQHGYEIAYDGLHVTI
jgi:phosphoribosyl 1,2-cyclic phosphate phosphodiesterase